MELRGDDHGMQLHLLRIISIFLYSFLSRKPQLAAFVNATQDAEPTNEHDRSEQEQILALLRTNVQLELMYSGANDECDAMLREQRVAGKLQRLLHAQRSLPSQQTQWLSALLHSQLLQLSEPFVQCMAGSVLECTLEYLCTRSATPALLYPLVDAVDSLSIETRECLDALALLWSYLAQSHGSDTVETMVEQYYKTVFVLDDDNQRGDTERTESLAKCFLRTLILHSDHIFRRDLTYSELPTLLDSDADDELETPVKPSTPSTDTSEVSCPLDLHEPVVSPPYAQPIYSAKSCSAEAMLPELRQRHSTSNQEVVVMKLPEDPADHEQLPAVAVVGLAAAAGTLAAALCAILN